MKLFKDMTREDFEKERKWFNETLGGRKPINVGDLKRLIENLPDEMKVRVSFQPRYQVVGMEDPVFQVSNVYGIDDGVDGRPVYSNPERQLTIQ